MPGNTQLFKEGIVMKNGGTTQKMQCSTRVQAPVLPP